MEPNVVSAGTGQLLTRRGKSPSLPPQEVLSMNNSLTIAISFLQPLPTKRLKQLLKSPQKEPLTHWEEGK